MHKPNKRHEVKKSATDKTEVRYREVKEESATEAADHLHRHVCVRNIALHISVVSATPASNYT